MNRKKIFLLLKMYFETGQGLLSHIKPFTYILFTLLVAKEEWVSVGIGGISWAVLCALVGKWWFDSGLAAEATTLANLFNPDLQEIKKGVKAK